jgi:hypothetical protein
MLLQGRQGNWRADMKTARNSTNAKEQNDRLPVEKEREPAVDDRQLLEAIVLQLVQYRAACRRFNERRRARGFDHRCSRLLDQIALRRSLLQLLAAEARSTGAAH